AACPAQAGRGPQADSGNRQPGATDHGRRHTQNDLRNMDQYIQIVSTFIETHQEWAGLTLGVLAMGESLLIIGLAIPATALMLLVGGLVGNGTLEPLPLIAWGIAGAALGDAISYFIGRLLGPKIVRSWPLNKQRRTVARARYF